MRKALLPVLMILAMVSCRKEPTTWDVDLLAPLASGRIDVTDLVADSLLSYGEGGLVILTYSDTFGQDWTDTLNTIPDTLIHRQFTTGLPVTIDVPPGVDFLTIEEDADFSPGEASLKEVRLKAGYLDYALKSYINGYLVYTYTLPTTELNGNALQISGNSTPGSPADPFVQEGSINISGYTIDLRGSDGLGTNLLSSVLDIATSSEYEQGATVSGVDSVTVDLFFRDLEIDYARGWFGEYDLSQTESTELEFMQAITAGTFGPEQLQVKLTVVNTLGVDAQLRVNSLDGINAFSGEFNSLLSPSLEPYYNLSRALDVNGTVIPTSELEITLNEGNSNLTSFVGGLPDALNYSIDLKVNPLGDISAGNDFLYADHPLEGRLDVEFPLCFSMGGLTFRDTLEIEEDLDDETVSGRLNITALNRFPFAASVHLWLIDANGNTVADLGTEARIQSAVVNDAGEAVEATSSQLSLNIPEGLIPEIRPENRWVVELVFDTAGDGSVIKVRAEDYLDLSIVADVSYQVELE